MAIVAPISMIFVVVLCVFHSSDSSSNSVPILVDGRSMLIHPPWSASSGQPRRSRPADSSSIRAVKLERRSGCEEYRRGRTRVIMIHDGRGTRPLGAILPVLKAAINANVGLIKWSRSEIGSRPRKIDIRMRRLLKAINFSPNPRRTSYCS
jgi:hypothetical protein